jgi:hypothetical protein
MLKTVTNSINASQIQTPISLPGDVTLTTGNLVIGTAGNGIDFSADPSAAGMTSELFDDYEEGNWTPVATNLTINSGTASWSGRYTKIGNIVSAYFLLQGGNFTITAASTQITLPFTSATNAAGVIANSASAGSFGGLTVVATDARFYVTTTQTGTVLAGSVVFTV